MDTEDLHVFKNLKCVIVFQSVLEKLANCNSLEDILCFSCFFMFFSCPVEVLVNILEIKW